jgi:hypothetical protein
MKNARNLARTDSEAAAAVSSDAAHVFDQVTGRGNTNSPRMIFDELANQARTVGEYQAIAHELSRLSSGRTGGSLGNSDLVGAMAKVGFAALHPKGALIHALEYASGWSEPRRQGALHLLTDTTGKGRRAQELARRRAADVAAHVLAQLLASGGSQTPMDHDQLLRRHFRHVMSI